MQRKFISGLAVCALFSAQVSAQDQDAKFYGAGVEKCEKWTSDRKENLISGTGQNIQWILGYINAFETFYLDLYDTTPKEISEWIDGYCQKNPDQRIRTAAAAFARSIIVGASTEK